MNTFLSSKATLYQLKHGPAVKKITHCIYTIVTVVAGGSVKFGRVRGGGVMVRWRFSFGVDVAS